ncbi:MAG: hypothetical protein PF961_02760 [Planctomycetota bacterium]|jgi:hypothetical protein|nr:hypothetical protein [Planctomycetota bacterium]
MSKAISLLIISSASGLGALGGYLVALGFERNIGWFLTVGALVGLAIASLIVVSWWFLGLSRNPSHKE